MIGFMLLKGLPSVTQGVPFAGLLNDEQPKALEIKVLFCSRSLAFKITCAF